MTVGFYEESLCPYCAEFTTKVAAPLFENGLSDYIEFDLVPYGNAKNTSEARQPLSHLLLGLLCMPSLRPEPDRPT